jgi:hypothetical protein
MEREGGRRGGRRGGREEEGEGGERGGKEGGWRERGRRKVGLAVSECVVRERWYGCVCSPLYAAEADLAE